MAGFKRSSPWPLQPDTLVAMVGFRFLLLELHPGDGGGAGVVQVMSDNRQGKDTRGVVLKKSLKKEFEQKAQC